jgi:hypothetical protein
MALLGMATADNTKKSVVAHKIGQIKHRRTHLAQAEPPKAAAKEEAPKPIKKLEKAVPGSAMPMTPAESDEKLNAGRPQIWGPHVKYSEQLANGDVDDDKELEDEDDPRDMIVDDDGFVN